jgi:uncharacterized protein YndB with AHSA1/START domain
LPGDLNQESAAVSRYQVSIDIDRPPEVVFRYMTDLETSAEWLGFEGVRSASGAPMAAGTRMRYSFSFLGRTLAMGGEITRYEPNRAVATRMAARGITFEGGATLEPAGDQQGTRLVTFGQLDLPWLFKPLAPLVASILSRYQARELKKLKRRLET